MTADSTVHFALGMLTGMILFIHPVIRDKIAGRKLAPAFKTWLIMSYGIAVFAIIPNILRRIGVPDTICNGWWMNIFLLHPLINRLKHGGMLIGRIGIIACFTIQYILLLTAIQLQSHRQLTHNNKP